MHSAPATLLAEKNAHPRDSNIQFFEEDHKYIVLTEPTVKYTSVTTWIHSHFPHFDADLIIAKMMNGRGWKEGHKYWGLTADEIKALWNQNKDSVSGAGTHLHYEIECFHNEPRLPFPYTNDDLYKLYQTNLKDEDDDDDDAKPGPIEWQYFIQFVKDHPHLKPYRTEWIIYHDDVKISGSIDMVYENPDGSLSIYDWKRSKNITSVNHFNEFAKTREICHLPNSNFWHYALQLNLYKTILEEKYGKTVRDLVLVRLHPDAEEKNYELIPLPNLAREIRDLFAVRKREL